MQDIWLDYIIRTTREAHGIQYFKLIILEICM